MTREQIEQYFIEKIIRSCTLMIVPACLYMYITGAKPSWIQLALDGICILISWQADVHMLASIDGRKDLTTLEKDELCKFARDGWIHIYLGMLAARSVTLPLFDALLKRDYW